VSAELSCELTDEPDGELTDEPDGELTDEPGLTGDDISCSFSIIAMYIY
jgi:hypothetical protein